MRRSGLNRTLLFFLFFFPFLGASAQEVLQEVRLEKVSAYQYRIRYKLAEDARIDSASVQLKIFRRRNGVVEELVSRDITPSGLRAGINYSYAWTTSSRQVRNGDGLQAKIILSFPATATEPARPVSVPFVKHPSVNAAPNANAGAFQDIYLPAVKGIWLDGTNSHDSDGRIVSYHWVQIGGPVALQMVHPDSARTAVKGANVEGRYAFELTVRDNTGHTATDRTVITLKAAPVTQAKPITPPAVTTTVPEQAPPPTVSSKTWPPLKGGPKNALVNLLVPGLGHYLVSGDPYGKGRKPAAFLVTAAYAGSLGGAFYFRSKFNKEYSNYQEQASYREYQYDDQGNIIGIRGMDAAKAGAHLDKAETYRRNAFICLGAGGAILVGDFVYTLLKGKKNRERWEKEARTTSTNLFLSADGTGFTAGLRFKF